MSASERKVAELEREVARLTRILSEQMLAGDGIEFEGIVNDKGVPRVSVRWDRMGAQFSVEAARAMAFDLLRVAEWADADSKIWKAAQEMELGERGTWALMSMVREGRGGEPGSSGKAGV